MYAVFRLFVFYILKWEKVMNMHKAKHYTQVTCLTCVTAENNCTRQISLSLTNKGVREKRRVISWEHFSFHTNDADRHAKKHKAVVAQTQEATNIPPTTHRQNTSTSQNCMLTLFLFKEYFRGMLRMSALLSNSFKVCCWLAEGLDMQSTYSLTLKYFILKLNFNVTLIILDSSLWIWRLEHVAQDKKRML